ncbi:hypothetical protein ACP70R_036603 [Stipagrostis hirtigluma subsp. patula]
MLMWLSGPVHTQLTGASMLVNAPARLPFVTPPWRLARHHRWIQTGDPPIRTRPRRICTTPVEGTPSTALPWKIAAMAYGNLRAFLILVVAQVCLLVAMAASAVQGRPEPVKMMSTPACCFYHPDCCQAAARAAATAGKP